MVFPYDVSKLPDFGAVKKCPKCGNKATVTRYVSGGTTTKSEIQDVERTFPLNLVQTPGCLRRKCTECKYYWYEKPMDYDERSEHSDG